MELQKASSEAARWNKETPIEHNPGLKFCEKHVASHSPG
jgi:hypothetical protein